MRLGWPRVDDEVDSQRVSRDEALLYLEATAGATTRLRQKQIPTG
jgi:hypothetical protein